MPQTAAQAKEQPVRRARRPRGSLSREEIVAGAFELVARDGVDALSMPRLARHIGVGVTSIYWYLRSKDDLLDALTDEAAARFTDQLPKPAGEAWDERLLKYFRAFRRIFQDLPELCDLIVMRSPMQVQSAQAMRRYRELLDREMGILVDAGFSPKQAMHAYMTLSTYTRGCILNARLYQAAGQRLEGPKSPVSEIDKRDHPVLARAAKYWTPSFATDRDFEAGLKIIIEGLRARLAAGSERSHRA